jgi:hypothetical protein
MDLVRVLTRAEVDSVRRRIEEPDRLVRRAIDRNDRPWTGDPKDVLTEIQEALRRIISVVASVYGEARGEPVVVPDTNALLENPRLESWAFEEFPRFTMVLVPEVLAELDRLKTEHRDPSMRDTVRRLVRQIGEYRRRGSLAEGVTLVKGISRVKAVATEPDFGASLPWLDRKVPDDRILAAFIEVMREHPESPAALATFDVNLQSKADFARLPLVEPPEPARPSEAAQHESSR